jgi:hypothetical protein
VDGRYVSIEQRPRDERKGRAGKHLVSKIAVWEGNGVWRSGTITSRTIRIYRLVSVEFLR